MISTRMHLKDINTLSNILIWILQIVVTCIQVSWTLHCTWVILRDMHWIGYTVKRKKETTELITTTLTAGIRFFSCSCISLCFSIGSWQIPGQKVTAILMAFEVCSKKKKVSCPFWKLTLLNWHIPISTFIKRISRLHYIHFRVIFYNVCTYA